MNQFLVKPDSSPSAKAEQNIRTKSFAGTILLIAFLANLRLQAIGAPSGARKFGSVHRPLLEAAKKYLRFFVRNLLR